MCHYRMLYVVHLSKCAAFSLLFLLLYQIPWAASSGTFELQILEIENYFGKLNGGGCCATSAMNFGSCTGQCRTYFNVCLKGYQNNASALSTLTESCSYGNTSSAVLGGNSFILADPDRANGKLAIPFKFSWTRTFTLILQAMDMNDDTIPDSVIEWTAYSGIILPSADWHTLTHNGHIARITYRIRVQCDKHYFNSTCMKFCRPRDDRFGHFTCDPNGDKECIAGWKGANCDIAVCKTGCHAEHGKCDYPGGCECRPGWRGEFCDECQPYPGCKHGYCNSPYDCICHTNWGGILCDRDLNYCGTHEPCLNGGTCSNPEPDQYLCNCSEGFSGSKCEIVVKPCVTEPCANGGTCLETQTHFQCICPAGWTGATCTTNIDECISSPCLNGATCIDGIDTFECLCTNSWHGNTCQYDVDECQTNVCVNANSCHNIKGDYECDCQNGWTGKNCDVNINDCFGQCEHAATCIDLVNDYHCVCPPGYTGRNCHNDINECESNPCKNGGECVDQVNGFRCICPFGFVGNLCQTDQDHCNPNPCENKAQCLNTPDDYYCHCMEKWQGKNCTIPRTQCSYGGLCDNTDVGGGGVASTSILKSNSDSNNGCMKLANKTSGIWVPTNVCGQHGECIPHNVIGYTCICHPGYTGKYCHQNIDECRHRPCLNGATCVDKVNSFECICQSGWEGDTCFINKNDCEPNVCKNNATCIDGLAEFTCLCKDGWKGKTCNSRHSHCDHNTCENGGTCLDLGHAFYCQCPTQWEGSVCQISKWQPCKSNSCMNGATCVNMDNRSYRCICPDGYQGDRCQYHVTNCNPTSCFNGGKCIEGDSWFLCECMPGFTGPDCRNNINECASSPCRHGSTCIDRINSYDCICAAGWRGRDCNEVDDNALLKGICRYSGQYYANNSNWQVSCNTCGCLDGKVTCTRVWCGHGNCLAHNSSPCDAQQVCVQLARDTCLSGPCIAWGECRDLLDGRRVGPPSSPARTTCWPNQAILSDSCVRMSLLVDNTRLPPSTNVNDICSQLRILVAVHEASKNRQNALIILCDLKQGFNDTLEITIYLKESPETDEGALSDSLRFVGDVIARKQSPSYSPLSSIVEVKIETALVTSATQDDGNKGTKSLMLITCIGLVFIILSILIYMYWKCRLSRGISSSNVYSSDNGDHTNLEEEKSNNLQNEENFRRYANPLKSTSSGGVGGALCIGNEASASASMVGCGSMGDVSGRVSIVRPLSSSCSAEMLEMISDNPNKILLSKTQNSEFQRNSLNCDNCGSSSKDKQLNYKSVVPIANYEKSLSMNMSSSSIS